MNKQKYKFTTVKENYEDYSSGRVLYTTPKATNFPVNLSLEIYKRCSEHLTKEGNSGPYTIYDPFCGVAYSLTIIGFFNGKNIKEIIASDADATMLEFAHKNLSLLTAKGINNRIKELNKFIQEYKKDSHKEALISAERLKQKTLELSLTIKEFQFNILSNTSLPKFINRIDMVIADLPYGKLTSWTDADNASNPTQQFLDKIKDRLNKKSIVTVVSDKQQTISYEGYYKIKSFKVGKRKILLLKLI
jgi:hypothetical protein